MIYWLCELRYRLCHMMGHWFDKPTYSPLGMATIRQCRCCHMVELKVKSVT